MWDYRSKYRRHMASLGENCARDKPVKFDKNESDGKELNTMLKLAITAALIRVKNNSATGS